ncbi:DUF6545 domain-containing protein [Streptomyces sp. NPDC059496]|uniref:DUF6545 domain-containing protein n=1 Tax=Streptomyces sp. NPDC059496 TaxID=3346851 RepID=UPI00368C575D
MKPSDLHRRLLASVIDIGTPYPLVIAGGYAIQAHGLVERFRQDLDVATANPAPLSANVAAAAFSVGFTGPARDVGVSRVREFVADYRAYRQLHPLWRDMIQAFPERVFLPTSSRQARWSMRTLPRLVGRQVIEVRDGRLPLRPYDDAEVEYTARDLRVLRHRQVVETRDGQLALGQYYNGKVAETARSLGEGPGLTRDDPEAVVEAAQLAAALRTRATGAGTGAGTRVGTGVDQGIPQPQPLLPHDPAAGAIIREADWLTRVAEAYGTSHVAATTLSDTRLADDAVIA